MRVLLALVLLASLALAGCSSAPLAAGAEPDRPNDAVTPATDKQAGGTLRLASSPQQVRNLPSLAMDCLGVGAEEGYEAISHGQVRVEWTPESSLVDELEVVVHADVDVSASGPSPIVIEWTAKDGGPSVVPFTVQAILPEGATALKQDVQVSVTVDSWDQVNAMAYSCGSSA